MLQIYCLYKISKKLDWTVYFWHKFQDSIKPMTATPLSTEGLFLFRHFYGPASDDAGGI